MMTDTDRLAAALPCEDPEEPCDADGRDEHRWCDSCIARHRIAADPTLICPDPAAHELAAAVRRLESQPQEYTIEAGPQWYAVQIGVQPKVRASTLEAAIEEALK